jgi:hypothetical protein
VKEFRGKVSVMTDAGSGIGLALLRSRGPVSHRQPIVEKPSEPAAARKS